jgi:hypothetical protein
METQAGEKADSRPFTCKVCGRDFRKGVHLRIHMATHRSSIADANSEHSDEQAVKSVTTPSNKMSSRVAASPTTAEKVGLWGRPQTQNTPTRSLWGSPHPEITFEQQRAAAAGGGTDIAKEAQIAQAQIARGLQGGRGIVGSPVTPPSSAPAGSSQSTSALNAPITPPGTPPALQPLGVRIALVTL